MRINLKSLILLTALTSNISSAKAPIHTGDTGIQSCGKWLSLRQKDTENRLDSTLEWASGFLTGAAIFSPKQIDPANGIDAHALSYWLDNYCRANPTKNLLQAIMEFIKEHPR